MFKSSSYPFSRAREQGPAYTSGLIGSIRKGEDRQDAVHLVKQGLPVGIYVRGVSIIAVDGGNPGAVDTIYRLKGEQRVGKPMATILPADFLVSLIDPEQIPAGVRSIFLDASELQARLGALCSIRVPLRRQAAAHLPSNLAPESDDGIYWLQSWVPDLTSPGGLLVKEFQEQEVELPAETSMNESGEPEIVDQRNALAYCANHGITFFLGDPQSRSTARGSFPILQVGPERIYVIREGHFSARLFGRLLSGAAVDQSHATAGKYPLVRTDSLATITSPRRLHDRLVTLAEGTEKE